MDYEALLANVLGLSSADEVHAELYDCMRHGKINAWWFMSEEGDHSCGISSSTTAGDDHSDNDDGDLNNCLLSNKRLKVTDDGGKRSSRKSDGEDPAKIGEGDRDDDNRDMNLALMMDASCLMLLSHAATSATLNNTGCPNKEKWMPSWAVGQLPKVLHCIGDRGATTIK